MSVLGVGKLCRNGNLKGDSLPYPDTISARILDLLIQIGSRGEMLYQDRQKLKNLDWINRSGFDEWRKIAEPLKQEDCEHLIRGLVITERELKWIGGSVAGAIWVFKVYERRFPPYHIEVANWVLENRGHNSYLPFGCSSSARNYDEYLWQQHARERNFQYHLNRQDEQKKAKKRREEKRIEDHMARLEQGKERTAKVRRFNAELASIPISKRLGVIASSGMPLEVVSKELLEGTLDAAASIDAETKSKLIQLIDRRKRGIWGRIKNTCAADVDRRHE